MILCNTTIVVLLLILSPTTNAFTVMPKLMMSTEAGMNFNTKYNCIKFSGGGIYFWWQAGACKYLSEKSVILGTKSFPIIGSSAGALAATLLCTGASFDKAASFAIDQAYRYSLFDSPVGLAGIWGNLVQEWLDELIPEEINAITLQNLYITATPFPNVFKGPVLLHSFKTKSDIIEACMASVHIPLFMNGRFTSKFKNKRYIDGSFWSFVTNGRKKDPLPPSLIDLQNSINIINPVSLVAPLQKPSLFRCNKRLKSKDISSLNVMNSNQGPQPFLIDWSDDLIFCENVGKGSIVRLLTPDGLYEMMDYGYNYMKNKYEAGDVPDFF